MRVHLKIPRGSLKALQQIKIPLHGFYRTTTDCKPGSWSSPGPVFALPTCPNIHPQPALGIWESSKPCQEQSRKQKQNFGCLGIAVARLRLFIYMGPARPELEFAFQSRSCFTSPASLPLPPAPSWNCAHPHWDQWTLPLWRSVSCQCNSRGINPRK